MARGILVSGDRKGSKQMTYSLKDFHHSSRSEDIKPVLKAPLTTKEVKWLKMRLQSNEDSHLVHETHGGKSAFRNNFPVAFCWALSRF